MVRCGAATALAAAALTAAFATSRWTGGQELGVAIGSVALAAAFAGELPALAAATVCCGALVVHHAAAGAGGAAWSTAVFLVVAAVVACGVGASRRRLLATLARRRDGSARARDRLAFLRAVTRAIDEGVYTMDRSGRITWVNAAAERLLGKPARALVGRPFKEALGCARVDAPCSGFKCRLRNVMVSREPYRAANDVLTRGDGSRFPVRYSSAPIFRGGEVVGAVVAFQDITAERRVEADEKFLADATEQLASSIDFEETLGRVARLALPYLGDWSMVVVVDEDGTPRRVAVESRDPSRAATSLELMRRYPIDLEADHGAGRVLRTGAPELLPVVSDFVGEAGATVRARAALLADVGLRSFMAVPMCVHGRLVGVLDFGVTAGERRFGAEDLAVARELARRCALAIENARLHRRTRDAVRAREHVLAVVSHDLRNALGAIRMAASLATSAAVADPPSAQRVRSAAARIGRASDRMDRLIGDLVDLAQIDAGRLSVVPGELSAAALAADAIDAVAALAAEGGVHVRSEIAGAGPLVHADGDRVHQVLVNLLSNAVKMVPPGGRVWVRCRARRDGAVFSVSDTGPGIARDEQRRMFDPFVRGPHASYRGSGLGLSIARGIVEAHRGRLWVVSRPGKGATFRFTLPSARAHAAERAPREADASPPLEPRRTRSADVAPDAGGHG